MVAADSEIGDHMRDSLVRDDDRLRFFEELSFVARSLVYRRSSESILLFDRANDRTIGSAGFIARPADRTLLYVGVRLARI